MTTSQTKSFDYCRGLQKNSPWSAITGRDGQINAGSNSPNSVSEIEGNEQFKLAEYTKLAERLFGPLEWSGRSAIAAQDEMSFELTPHDVSLSVAARGTGDTLTYMENVASLALAEGVVTVELAGAEILVPFSG